MWGTGTKKEQPENLDFSQFDIDLESVEFNEAELEDPELLAELAKLQGGEPKPNQRPKPHTDTVEINLDNLFESLPTEEVDVKFDEKDMDDPMLLAELASVIADVHTEPETVKVDSPVYVEQQASNEIISTNVQNIDENMDIETLLTSKDVTELEEQIRKEKLTAIKLKKEGNTAQALIHLRNSKKLEKKVKELISLDDKPEIIPVAKEIPEIKTNVIEKGFSNLPPIEKESSTARSGESPNTTNPPEINLEELVTIYRKSALEFKRQNDIPKAQEMLRASKQVQRQIDLISSGQPDPTFAISNLPKFTTPKLENLPPTFGRPAEVTRLTDQVATEIICTLDKQITLAGKIAAQYLKSGEKSIALEFHKRRKEFIEQRDQMKKGDLQCTLNYETVEYELAISNDDIKLDEMLIEINCGTKLKLRNTPDLNTVVCYDIGWPFDTNGTLTPGKGETIALKGDEPAFNTKFTLKIERGRSFQRYLERKKAVFSLYHNGTTLFGLLGSRIPIGKVVLKLDGLLSKCEIGGSTPICDMNNPRRNVGGDLDVRLKLRVPLLKAEVIKKSEKWVRVVWADFKKNKDTVETPNTQHQTTVISPATSIQASANSKTSLNIAAKVLEEDVDDGLESAFNNPDSIESNAVLEAEHVELISKIASESNSTIKEELMVLKGAYELKMQMLVMAIQLGNLDMNSYLTRVDRCIIDTREAALKFKRQGNINLAKKALKRVKLMTAEVEEARANS